MNNTKTVQLLSLFNKKEIKSFNTMESCMHGIQSVFNNTPNKELVDDSVIKDLKGHKFRVEKITLVKAIDSYSCDVVARDSKGHRSYRLTLDKNSEFTHGFKITNIKGQKIISKYQWEAL